MSEMKIYDKDGSRLYLDQNERKAFLNTAKQARPKVRTFAEILAFTGCRISEALELVPQRVELSENRIILRSLKKRKDNVFRAVPCPTDFLERLSMVHDLQRLGKGLKMMDDPLWGWTRQHANEIVKLLMVEAKIPEGKHRTPKGLRHAFGVHAISNGVPLHLLQKWMGHAFIQTTAIYANAIRAEETTIAEKMWA